MPSEIQLLAFMQDQVTNAEDTSDEELIEHLGNEGVPNWLAAYYVKRYRERARLDMRFNFQEPDEVVDACVHIAAGYAQDLSLLDDEMLPHAEALSAHTREIIELKEACAQLLKAAQDYVTHLERVGIPNDDERFVDDLIAAISRVNGGA